MATCLQLALTNPVPGQEEEFNRWYDAEHLVHGVLTPGMLAGQRFRRAVGPWPGGRHDYLAIYEIDDPAFALGQLARVRGTDAMPISPSIDMATVQPPLMWRRATVRTARHIATDTSERETLVLVLANAEEGQGEAFEAALVRGGLAELADLPGVLAAELLTLADEQLRGSARKHAYGILLELHDEAAGVSSLEHRLRALRHLDAERWCAAVFRPIGRRLTQEEARRRARAERG
jgi:hypothetical protein